MKVRIELTKAQVDAILHAVDICKSDYDASIAHNELGRSGKAFIRRLHEAENKIVKALNKNELEPQD